MRQLAESRRQYARASRPTRSCSVILKDAARAGVGALLISVAREESLICGVVAIEPTSMAGANFGRRSGRRLHRRWHRVRYRHCITGGRSFSRRYRGPNSPELEFVSGSSQRWEMLQSRDSLQWPDSALRDPAPESIPPAVPPGLSDGSPRAPRSPKSAASTEILQKQID